MLKPIHLACCAALAVIGCERKGGPGSNAVPRAMETSLSDARRGFQTTLARRESAGEAVDVPPEDDFHLIQYDSAVGKLAAYVSPPPNDGQKHPVVIWITGGDCNSIGDVWSAQPIQNDQTPSAYRRAGILMMFPSLRGGNMNPGVKEGFFGEVDDVLAAADYLAAQPHIDANRIYLGGHSTGGTLVMLVAACSNRFRAVFSFGPVDNVAGYGPEYLPFATSARELELRSPAMWLQSIESPTFVIEGANRPGNLASLETMKLARTTNAPDRHWIHLLGVRGADHFSVLAPVNELIAAKLSGDTGPTCNVTLTEEELSALFVARTP